MIRVLFIRSTTVGWPKRAPDGKSIIERKPGIPALERHRGYIGSELDVPEDVAKELLRQELATVPGGLSGAPQQATVTLTALPPPIAPDPAFALHPVDESGPFDEHAAALEASGHEAAAPAPRTALRHRIS